MNRIEKLKSMKNYEHLHMQDKTFLKFYQWLMCMKEMGDNSYLNYASLIANCEDLADKNKPTKITNKNNYVEKYMELQSIINLKSFRNEVWSWEDIVIRNGKYDLIFD